MKITKPLAVGLAAGLSLATLAVALPAIADPVSNSYVLVGSDTLQDSANALTNGTTITGSQVRIKANGSTLASFDAFGTSTIQVKTNGPRFARPSGSGDGVKALSASIKSVTYTNSANITAVNIGGQVDIARSSSGPGTNANASGQLLYVPYARDAVAYAYNDPTGALASLTTAQLKAAYTGETVVVGGVTVKPLIPQSSSGTRKFFLSAIGVSSDASCTLDSCATSTLAENDASVLTQAGQIIPFSAASWIAQSTGAAPSTISASSSVTLGSPNGVAPFTGSGATLAPNATFYSSSFGRDTYLVVESARVTSGNAKYDATLANLMDPTSATSLTNFGDTPTTAGAVKRKFGFLAPSSTTPLPAYATLP